MTSGAYVPKVSVKQARVVLVSVWLGLLPLVGFIPLWATVLFSLLLLSRIVGYWDRLSKRWVMWPLLVLLVLLLWVTLRHFIGPEGGVTFLSLLIGMKVHEAHTRRDWRIVLALGYFLAATPLLFTQSLGMACWMVFVFFSLTTAMVFLSGHYPLKNACKLAAKSMALTFPAAAFLFVVMPRFPGSLWSFPVSQSQQALSGLGDNMEPGSISHLLLNPEPAFFVVFENGIPQKKELYWRMVLLGEFDGTRWLPDLPTALKSVDIAGGRLVDYVVTVRPDKGRLPVLDIPVQQEFYGSLVSGLLSRLDARQTKEIVRYRVQSMLGARYIAKLLPAQQKFYLSTPKGNDKTRALAQQFKKISTNEMAWVTYMLQWLHSNGFEYTLNPPLLTGSNRVDEFLFTSRQGFCEHYASAFAFAARAAGIPSRVVLGYQGGERNPLGNFWQVRSSDAHAWVELWLAQSQQWVRVDPTAAVAVSRLEQGVNYAIPSLKSEAAWLHSMRQNWTAVQFAWQQMVLGFDATKQQQAFQWLGLGEDVNRKSIVKALAFGLAFLCLGTLWQAKRYWGSQDRLALGWRILLAKLKRTGSYALSDGPLQVRHKARKHVQSVPTLKASMVLIDEYMALKYGTHTQSKQQVNRWFIKVLLFYVGI